MHFFLLILEVLFNFILDIIYKYGKFSKTLLKKSLEFILSKKVDFILLFLIFMLLSSKIDPILEKQSCKKDVFRVYSFS